MKEILTLFSTPVYASEIFNLNLENILNQIKKLNMSFDDSGIEISSDIYLIDKLPELKIEIVKHVNNYFYNILQYEENFKYYFPDSWVVKTNPDFKQSRLHSHSNSLYSGVVYLNVPPGCGDILFARSQTTSSASINHIIPKKSENIFNSDSWIISPHSGQILIFPSYSQHQILANNLDSPRYSFAFNILPDNYRCNDTSGRVLDR